MAQLIESEYNPGYRIGQMQKGETDYTIVCAGSGGFASYISGSEDAYTPIDPDTIIVSGYNYISQGIQAHGYTFIS